MWDSLAHWFSSPDNQRLALGLIAGLGVGLLLGAALRRGSGKKSSGDPVKGDKAFLKGIHYILSNDHDHAIEEFTKAVQVNSDTIETYVALGNLYRSRGDIERAVRIRQSIILRPNIDPLIRLQALVDLGHDYRKGGFLNRSLSTFQQVLEQDPSNVGVLEEMEKIYEDMNDWDNAYKARQRISRITKGDDANIMAHHLVESGKAAQARGEPSRAKTLFQKALSTHRACVDAYLHLGDIHFQSGEYKKAISVWEKLVQVAPHFTFLAYRRLENAYARMKDLKPVEAFLKKCAAANSDAFTHLALARYLYNEGDVQGAVRETDNALDLSPAFWEARKFKGQVLLDHKRQDEALEEYRMLLEHLEVPFLRFQCANCGFEPSRLQWQCPQCRKWDSIGLMETTGAEPHPSA